MPCSASGMAQPRITSSTISGFDARAPAPSAPAMAAAAMSSGRTSAQRRPCRALPTAVRTLATMTTSRMVGPRTSVPERLAFLEHVLDALLGLLACRGATGRPRARGRGSAARWRCRGARSPPQRMVATLVATSASCSLIWPPRLRVVDAHLEGGEGGAAEDGDVGARAARAGSRRGARPRATCLASSIRRSGLGGERVGRRSGRFAAPPAPEVETLAKAIRSKARLTKGKASAPSTPAQRSWARSASSLVPPPPGITPTPTSTRPM